MMHPRIRSRESEAYTEAVAACGHMASQGTGPIRLHQQRLEMLVSLRGAASVSCRCPVLLPEGCAAAVFLSASDFPAMTGILSLFTIPSTA